MIEKRHRSLAWFLLLALMAFSAGCSRQGEAQEQTGRPAVAVEAVRAGLGNIEEIIEVVGVLTPRNQAEIKPEFVGVIREVYVQEWVRVQKGDKLAQMDTRELLAAHKKALAAIESSRATTVQYQVTAQRAELELGRISRLRQTGSVSQQNLDNVLTERNACVARVVGAQALWDLARQDAEYARTRLEKATIVAPIDGVVSYQGLMIGDLVGEMNNSRSVTRIIDTSKLKLTVNVPSREMNAIKVGQQLKFTCDAFPGQTFAGTVTFINPVVSDLDRSVKIEAEVPNDQDTLKGGLFVKGAIQTGRRENVLLLPRECLTNWDIASSQAKIWVAQGRHASQRQVTIGGRQADLVEIKTGVAPGELVITRGGFNLNDGDQIKLVKGQG